MARRLIVPLLLFAALIGAACAEPAPPTLAAGSLEAALPAAIWSDDPALVSAVECPELAAELIAQSTVCTAVLDSDEITVDVAIDIVGEATAVVREPLYEISAAVDQLRTRLELDLGFPPDSVECDRDVVVVDAGIEVECEASRENDVIEFTLVLLDREGTWEPRFG